MRSKLNLTGSTHQRIGQKLGMSAMPLSRVPMEWLDAGSWRLPSGKALAEFALQAGFLAPLLLKADRENAAGRPMLETLPGRTKHFGKGGN
ncbi:MAG TPA: hypothetical protein VIX89_16495 [Bryobacteraceae bacterium]